MASLAESYRLLNGQQELDKVAALPEPGAAYVFPPYSLEHVDSQWVTREGNPRYTQLEKLQEGGQAKIFKAFDEKLQRLVAIKAFNEPNSPRLYLDVLELEAKVMARLRSNPHVLKVYDFFIEEEDTQWNAYMVMEYLDPAETPTLRDMLDRTGYLRVGQVSRILKSAAAGLDSFACQGIIHRDVKPSNLFLEKDGRVIFGDFGISSPIADLIGLEIQTMWTEVYTPTEKYSEESNRLDLYSLGALTYTVLTGHTPFSTIDQQVIPLIVHRHMQRQLAPETLKELDGFFETALATDPDQRFASGTEMAETFINIATVTLEIEAFPIDLELP